MKRKNLDYLKTRRFLKKSKFSENLNSSSYLYIKLFFLWFIVVLTDFLIEFRFEYLWPFYLLIKNIYDSFKYQGLVFSAFFVFITLTSDMICFFLIPVQWLFFTASTYIWLQYVWNSEKGICLQTLTVWLIFVYIEATVRLKELKNISSNLNICRTFAAQCIGYPFVTFGFGFKKYINYKIMLRRKKDVNIENDLLFFAIQKSLSTYGDCSNSSQNISFLPLQNKNIQKENIDTVVNDSFSEMQLNSQKNSNLSKKNSNHNFLNMTSKFELDSQKSSEICLNNNSLLFKNLTSYVSNMFWINFNKLKTGFENSAKKKVNTSVISLDNIENNQNIMKLKILNSFINSIKNIGILLNKIINIFSSNHSEENDNKVLNNLLIQEKNDLIQRLENDIKTFKTNLQISRELELDYKEKLNKLQINRNEIKYQCNKLEQDNNILQTKLKSSNNVRQQDKNTINILEKKLLEEKKSKNLLEKQLSNEKKLRSSKESQNSKSINKLSLSSLNPQNSVNSLNKIAPNNCIETCKQKNQELENIINQFKVDIQNKDVEINLLKIENQSLKTFKDSYSKTEVLMNVLSAMQERNNQLENSLSAETKLKLELFSVLGETKRQLEMNQNLLFQKSKETDDLRSKLSQLMAVMPAGINDSYSLIFSNNYLAESSHEKIHEPNNIEKKEKNFEWKNLSNNQSLESTSDNLITSKSSSPDLS